RRAGTSPCSGLALGRVSRNRTARWSAATAPPASSTVTMSDRPQTAASRRTLLIAAPRERGHHSRSPELGALDLFHLVDRHRREEAEEDDEQQRDRRRGADRDRDLDPRRRVAAPVPRHDGLGHARHPDEEA